MVDSRLQHPAMPAAARGAWVRGDVPLAADGTLLPEPPFYGTAPVSERPTVFSNKGFFWLRYMWKGPKRKRVRRIHHERYESKQAAESWRLPLMRFLNGPRRKEPKRRTEGVKRKRGGAQLDTGKKHKSSSPGLKDPSDGAPRGRLESRTAKYRKRLKECEIQIEYLKDRLSRGSALELVRPMDIDSAASNKIDEFSDDSGNEDESGSEEKNESGEEGEDGDGSGPMESIEEIEEGNAEAPQFNEKDIQRATLQANAVLIVYCFIQQDILEAIDGERKRSPIKTMVQKAAALTAASWYTVYRCVCIAVVAVLSVSASHVCLKLISGCHSWFKNFENNDRTFKQSAQGRWARNFILDENDLIRKFDLHARELHRQRILSVEAMTKYVNDEKQGLFADPEDRQFLRTCRISFPVSSTTVHSWMVRQGGRWEPTRKDYYTDRVRVAMRLRVGCSWLAATLSCSLLLLCSTRNRFSTAKSIARSACSWKIAW